MGRLISSPSPTPIARSRRPLFLSHRAALPSARFSPPPTLRLARLACGLFSKRDAPPAPSFTVQFHVPRASSSSIVETSAASPCVGEHCRAQPQGGGELARSAVPKVVRSMVLTILSAIVLTVLQPILAPPAYATVQSAAKSGGKAISAELLSSAWTGFFAGCLHTLSGPDHLAALAPLSIGRTRLESALVGALWGCGHDAGQVIFGLLFLILKDRLHIEILRTWGTRVVGLTLLAIGANGIREASEVPTPCVALENGECDVSTIDDNEAAPTGKRKVGFATFATGIVHGLQPDALMMILPALALPSRLAGAAFLVMFLLGTVISMGSYTVFIGSCTQALKERVPRITEKLTWVASLIAISMGLALLVSQFFGFSLY